MRAARSVLAAAALGAVGWLLAGRALINYDTLYALVWGRGLAEGALPDYGTPLAPTPHPLATAAGVLLAPLGNAGATVHGEAATAAAGVLAFAALGALALTAYRLGALWFTPLAGALAAAILLTRRPFLDFGARAYVDIPYIALLLAALAAETRRPRAGAPVMWLLAAAGLLRPEAWLFAAAYAAWLWRGRALRPGLVLLAAAAPVIWLLADLAVTGDPLHSLTGTRETAEQLGRVTGLDDVPLTAPRRLGEIMREPGLLAAAAGAGLGMAWLRARGSALGLAACVLAFAAFCGLAAAGLPILGRYLLPLAALLAVFAGGALGGWRALEAAHPWRRRWRAAAAVLALAFVVLTPAQAGRIGDLRDALARQDQIQDDLRALVRDGTIFTGCSPLTVPNHRPVPLLALWLDADPARIVAARTTGAARRGTFVTTASPAVAADYVLDRRDADRRIVPPPPGFEPAGANASWRVLTSGCG